MDWMRDQQRPRFLPAGDVLVWTIIIKNEIANWVTVHKPFHG